MDELSEQIRKAYEAAQASELQARQHPENLEQAIAAAERFELAATLSRRLAGDDDYVEEVRRIALVLVEYYLAQKHKSLGWYSFERRDCSTALAELAHERTHYESAIRNAEGLIPLLSDDGKAFLRPQLQSWKLSLEGVDLENFTYHARQSWDTGNYIKAIDWYRRSEVEARRLLELE